MMEINGLAELMPRQLCVGILEQLRYFCIVHVSSPPVDCTTASSLTPPHLFVVTDTLLAADAEPLVLHLVPHLPRLAQLDGLHVVVVRDGVAEQRVFPSASHLKLVAPLGSCQSNLPHKLNTRLSHSILICLERVQSQI